jgi:translation initiation factor 2D
MGDKCTPDGSFTPERVFPLGAVVPEGASASASAPPASAPEAPAAAAGNAAERVAALSLSTPAPQPAAAAATATSAPAAPAAPAPENDIDTSTPEGMDAMLDWCLLRGLVDKVPDGELPIKCEELYSKVLLPTRPAGTTVDIKKSGYKKLIKLYNTWEKAGLITVKAVHKIVRHTRHALLSARPTARAHLAPLLLPLHRTTWWR